MPEMKGWFDKHSSHIRMGLFVFFAIQVIIAIIVLSKWLYEACEVLFR